MIGLTRNVNPLPITRAPITRCQPPAANHPRAPFTLFALITQQLHAVGWRSRGIRSDG